MTQIEQNAADETVKVSFENGVTDVGSFIIGCDGLHSNARKEIFGSEKADYTGLTQVRSTLWKHCLSSLHNRIPDLGDITGTSRVGRLVHLDTVVRKRISYVDVQTLRHSSYLGVRHVSEKVIQPIS